VDCPADKDAPERLADPAGLFVLSGPSGAGKNAIIRRLAEQGRAVRAVTATTRPPAAGETDGEDYYFVGEDEFDRWIQEGRLIEHARYVGHWYGTPIASANRASASGLPVLLQIDVQGALQIKEKCPEVTLIFVDAPSDEELRRRLVDRGRDDARSIDERLRRAREERACAGRYDHRVVNDDLDDAVEEVGRIIEAP
jgi:guanylate kinase